MKTVKSILWSVWSVLFVLNLIFLGINLAGSASLMSQVGQLLFSHTELPIEAGKTSAFLGVLGVSSLGLVFLSIFFRKVFFTRDRVFANGSDRRAIHKWVRTHVLSWVMVEVVAIYGVVAAISDQAGIANAFFVTGLAVFLILRPDSNT